MNNPTWSSEAMRCSSSLCLDVKAGNSSVVLGIYIGDGEMAADIELTPDQAVEIATALLKGAAEATA